MKTYRHLYPQVIAFASLHAAFRKARRGKRNRAEVAAFEYDLEHNLFQLQEELAGHSYRPGPYRNFYLRERKLRLSSRRTRSAELTTKPSIRLEVDGLRTAGSFPSLLRVLDGPAGSAELTTKPPIGLEVSGLRTAGSFSQPTQGAGWAG